MAEPMYRQIAEDLQRRIESGELPPGAQLPTEFELREQYDASRNTIRDAIKRIMRAIETGRTRIAWDGARPVATVTASPNHHGIWPEAADHEPAVYIRRIVVSREYSGIGLGGQLLDWAGLHARHAYGARWLRTDVWTTNIELHRYYRRQGFTLCGHSPVPRYPSAALFQKPTDRIGRPGAPLFREGPEAVTANE